MTKRDLVVRIANETGLTQLAVKEVIQKFLDSIVDNLLLERMLSSGISVFFNVDTGSPGSGVIPASPRRR